MRDVDTQQNRPCLMGGSAGRTAVLLSVRIRPYGVFDYTTGPQPDLTGAGGRLSGRKIGETGEGKAGLDIHLPE